MSERSSVDVDCLRRVEMVPRALFFLLSWRNFRRFRNSFMLELLSDETMVGEVAEWREDAVYVGCT